MSILPSVPFFRISSLSSHCCYVVPCLTTACFWPVFCLGALDLCAWTLIKLNILLIFLVLLVVVVGVVVFGVRFHIPSLSQWSRFCRTRYLSRIHRCNGCKRRPLANRLWAKLWKTKQPTKCNINGIMTRRSWQFFSADLAKSFKWHFAT